MAAGALLLSMIPSVIENKTKLFSFFSFLSVGELEYRYSGKIHDGCLSTVLLRFSSEYL